MFTSLNKVDAALCESGMNVPCIENGIKAYHCVVDGGQGVNINVNGKLFLCEHYIDNDFFGDIYHPEIKDFDKEIAGDEFGVMFDFDELGELLSLLSNLILKEKEQCTYKIWKLQED